jgi:hypothetical protein
VLHTCFVDFQLIHSSNKFPHMLSFSNVFIFWWQIEKAHLWCTLKIGHQDNSKIAQSWKFEVSKSFFSSVFSDPFFRGVYSYRNHASDLVPNYLANHWI